jgi:hypothetical protein
MWVWSERRKLALHLSASRQGVVQSKSSGELVGPTKREMSSPIVPFGTTPLGAQRQGNSMPIAATSPSNRPPRLPSIASLARLDPYLVRA